MNKLAITEFKNQRILTTAQLAESYETTGDIISKNFNRNIDRYQECKHFFVLGGDTKREFLDRGQFDDGSKNATRLYLWTEKGCLLHAKSLGTDKAWEVYEMLIETYFNKQALKQMSQAELTAMIAQNQVEIERTANKALEIASKLDSKITNALDVFTAPVADDWKHSMNSKINQIITNQNLNYQTFRGDLYSELEGKAHCDLTARQSNLRKRLKGQGAKSVDCKAVSKLEVIDRDVQLKAIFEGVVQKYQAKFV